MTTLAHTRSGAGAPLVLLHGLGSARQAWDPVIQALTAQFDVVAVDLPGFGGSEPLPAGVEPLPAVLAACVARFLDEIGVTAPHVAGNSLGGWVALELAALRPVASVALLSPAGLWRDKAPLYNRVSLRTTRWLAVHAAGPLTRLVRYRLARILVLGQTHGRPARITPEYARMAIRAMATGPGFDATMAATAPRCYRSGPAFDAPVTVGFGARDFLLRPHRSRQVDQLPPGTHVAPPLPGCGHVPMADNPGAVTAFIATATSRGHAGRKLAH
jgi:pimeloyl-ACP methyl ester carboxylesterase